MAEGLLVEGGEDDVEVLLEEGLVAGAVSPVRRDVKLHAGPAVDARRDPEIDPALRHLVEKCDVLRHPQGVPVGQDDPALADAQPVAEAGHVRPEENGIRARTVPAVPREMMLGQPHSAEAQLIEQSDRLVHLVEERGPRVVLSDVVVERAVEAHPGPLAAVDQGGATLFQSLRRVHCTDPPARGRTVARTCAPGAGPG